MTRLNFEKLNLNKRKEANYLVDKETEINKLLNSLGDNNIRYRECMQ